MVLWADTKFDVLCYRLCKILKMEIINKLNSFEFLSNRGEEKFNSN